MAEKRPRRSLRSLRSIGRESPVEIAIMEFEIDVRPNADMRSEDTLDRALEDIREGLSHLEDQLDTLVTRDLGPAYRVGKVVVEEGSILVLVPILAEATVYYVAARQLLEYLRRDMRRLVDRWLRRHSPHVEVRQDVLVRRPPLVEAGELSDRIRRRWRDDLLLQYLVVSHAFLLVSLATASGFLLAHVL
jgi:hypothetical protein